MTKNSIILGKIRRKLQDIRQKYEEKRKLKRFIAILREDGVAEHQIQAYIAYLTVGSTTSSKLLSRKHGFYYAVPPNPREK